MDKDIINEVSKLFESGKLDSKAFNHSHDPSKILGVFWYKISMDDLDIVFDPSISHNHRDKFNIFRKHKVQKDIIAGRVYKNRNHIYLMVYNTDILGNRLCISGSNLINLKHSAEKEIKGKIDFIIDGYGNSLMEKRKNAS